SHCEDPRAVCWYRRGGVGNAPADSAEPSPHARGERPMKPARRSIGYHVFRVFAPVLLLAAVLRVGPSPPDRLLRTAPAYNVFHIIFGTLGLACVLSGREGAVAAFNLGFGAIDLYQALASFAHWFPIDHFRWMRADDVLHVVLGVLLVSVGSLKKRN